MFTYHVEKGILPVLPGDSVYYIDSDQARTVCKTRVTAVILEKNDQLSVQVENHYGENEIGKDLFLTAEEAEKIAAKKRPAPPYPYSSAANKWMPIEKWIPLYESWYGVRIALSDGTFSEEIAYYDRGTKYKDERGFYKSDRRNSPKIENVTAWIDADYLDSEERCDENPADFRFSPIEEMDLSVRTYNVLKKNGIRIVLDILKLHDRESLEKLRNLGSNGYEEIIRKLEDYELQADHLK